MATKLFVGSLSWDVNDRQLNELFSTVGEVVSATVITDRDSGRSKGFGFVEMAKEGDAKEAIKTLNNKELDGRAIIVNEAKPKEEKSGGSYKTGSSFNRSNYSDRRY